MNLREDTRLEDTQEKTRGIELANGLHEARTNQDDGPAEDEQRDQTACTAVSGLALKDIQWDYRQLGDVLGLNFFNTREQGTSKAT